MNGTPERPGDMTACDIRRLVGREFRRADEWIDDATERRAAPAICRQLERAHGQPPIGRTRDNPIETLTRRQDVRMRFGRCLEYARGNSGAKRKRGTVGCPVEGIH